MRGIKGGGGENAREGVKKDLKSFDASHAGSSPAPGTIQKQGDTEIRIPGYREAIFHVDALDRAGIYSPFWAYFPDNPQ